MAHLSGRLCRVSGLLVLAAMMLAACEDTVYAVKKNSALRDLVQHGQLTVYRREF